MVAPLAVTVAEDPAQIAELDGIAEIVGVIFTTVVELETQPKMEYVTV